MRFLSRRGYNSIRITIDYLFLYSLFALGMYIHEVYYVQPFTFEQILLISIASVLVTLGHGCYFYALANGIGGKVQGILQLQSIVQIAFEIAID